MNTKEDIINDPINAVRRFIEQLLQHPQNHERLFKIPRPEGLLLKDAAGHFHTTPELFLQFTGKLGFSLPFQELVLQPGHICLIPSGLPHNEVIIETARPFLQAVISIFSGNVAMHFAGGESGAHPRYVTEDVIFSSRNISRLTGYLDDMVSISHHRRGGRKHCLSGISTLILGALLELLDSPVTGDNYNHKVTRCQRYIERDFSNPLLNVNFLARKIKCAPDYLSHLFHQETGLTLSSLITRHRLEHAYMLLHNSSLNISEIALHCGFQDPGYFTRVFKKKRGITPRQYRQEI